MILSGHTCCPQKPGTCGKARTGWARMDSDAPGATVGGGGPAFGLLFWVLKADGGAFRPTACWAAVSTGNMALPLEGCRSGAGPRAGTGPCRQAPPSQRSVAGCGLFGRPGEQPGAGKPGIRAGRRKGLDQKQTCPPEGAVNAVSSPCSGAVRLPGLASPAHGLGEGGCSGPVEATTQDRRHACPHLGLWGSGRGL